MTETATVRLRRTWPQRLVIVACAGVIAAAIVASFFVRDFYAGVAEIGRIEFAGDLLFTETDPSEPVNFLIVGLDSAVGIDLDDPIHIGRQLDARGTHNADSISLLRVDPVGGRAWALSIPRDLLVDIPGSSTYRINASSLIGGAPLLVETVVETFAIPINHYVQLDFLAFREVVDELDGVTMCFAHAARDLETGFAAEPGCQVLDGEKALAYVRSRNFEEWRGNGRWEASGNADLGRIERQQEFVVAAIERAVERGARNPTALATLISASADSVVLDQGLTPAELVPLAQAFTSFDPESLVPFSPAVYDGFEETEDGGSRWIGLGLGESLDAEMFQILRGLDDALPRADVRVTVAGADEAVVVVDAEHLRSLGFSVAGERIVEPFDGPSVIVHPTGSRAGAELLARFLLPTPALVEDPLATELTLALGRGHEAVSIFYPVDVEVVADALAAHGSVDPPVLTDAGSVPSAPES